MRDAKAEAKSTRNVRAVMPFHYRGPEYSWEGLLDLFN